MFARCCSYLWELVAEGTLDYGLYMAAQAELDADPSRAKAVLERLERLGAVSRVELAAWEAACCCDERPWVDDETVAY